MNKALNLRYRPQKISELDHLSAQKALLKIFQSGQVPHAFLFSGPKGIGKTSAARIVAKAINCERVRERDRERVKDLPAGRQNFEPCGECATCISITNGTNLDVLEIDAASNRGIDDIRELRDKIKLAPSSAKFKVYIIDEVHMLTNEAFNALLKTLEEPPEHAIFILCTTVVEKLPETITSRCTRINFKKATKEEVVEKLKKINQKEGFKFKEEDLAKIAQVAGGSFRDAIKILEQAATSSVDEVLEVAGGGKASDFLNLMADRKTKEALVWLGGAVDEGVNLRLLIEEMLGILRETLLKKYGLEMEETVEKGLTENLSLAELKSLINLLTQAAVELRTAVIPQLPLEMAVVEWSELGKQKWDGGSEKLDSEVGSGKVAAERKIEEKKKVSSDQDITPQHPASHLPPLISVKLEEILNKWPEVLEKVKPLNHSIQAFLKASRPLAVDEEYLTLEVFYKFHKDQLETDHCRRIVEQVCGQVLSLPIKIKYVLGEKPKKVVVESVAAPVASKPSEDDLVHLAEEIFNGGSIIN